MPLSRHPVDAQWQRMVRETLTHRVTVLPATGQNEFGQMAYGAPRENVPCFIDGAPRRIVTPQGTEVQVSWQVFFPGREPLGLGDRLEQGRDLDGTVLLAGAVIVHIDDSNTPRYGQLLRTAFCVVQ
jgi:hypothetical protein